MTPLFDMVDPRHHPGWDDLVRALPGASIFHTSCWTRTLSETYGYRPCYLARTSAGKLEVLVPLMEVSSFLTGKRAVSLPFTDYCDLLLTGGASRADLLAGLKQFGKNARWRYLEFRGCGMLTAEAVPSCRYYRHDLSLSAGADRVYENLKSSVRRNIRTAERAGLEVETEGGAEALRTYYRLHCLTRKRNGLPPQPFRFFQNLGRHVIGPGHGRILIVRHQGAAIAGAIFLHFGSEATYKYGASDDEHLGKRPNDFLLWTAIRMYAAEGYQRFSFGRTDTHDQGLLQFKRGWGAEETQISYFRYDLRRDSFINAPAAAGHLASELIGSLPLSVLKLAGTLLYRHMG